MSKPNHQSRWNDKNMTLLDKRRLLAVCQKCGKDMQATEEQQNYYNVRFNEEGGGALEFYKATSVDDCGWRFYCEDDHEATEAQAKALYDAIAEGARIL